MDKGRLSHIRRPCGVVLVGGHPTDKRARIATLHGTARIEPVPGDELGAQPTVLITRRSDVHEKPVVGWPPRRAQLDVVIDPSTGRTPQEAVLNVLHEPHIDRIEPILEVTAGRSQSSRRLRIRERDRYAEQIGKRVPSEHQDCLVIRAADIDQSPLLEPKQVGVTKGLEHPRGGRNITHALSVARPYTHREAEAHGSHCLQQMRTSHAPVQESECESSRNLASDDEARAVQP